MVILVNYGDMNWYWSLWWISALGQMSQLVSHAQQGTWETLWRPISLSTQRWYRIASHCSFSPNPFSHSRIPPRREKDSSFSVIGELWANFIHDNLDKQYLELVENHHFTYCSIYHNCKTTRKTLDHVPQSYMFITHIAMRQILSYVRFDIFHCQIVLLLGGRPELLQFWCCLFTEKCMLNSERKKKKRKNRRHRYFNGHITLPKQQ